jgi:MFS family permease
MFDAVGSGMYYSSSALYFTSVVGLSVSQVGVGLSIGAVAGLLGVVPVGLIADRLGAGPIYIWIQVLRGLAFTAFCLISNFTQFTLVCVAAGLTEAALPPMYQAIVGALVPGEDRVDTLAKIRAVRNLGFGLGALAATAAIGLGAKVAFLVLVAGNAASYFGVAAALVRIGVGKVVAPIDPTKRSPIRFVLDRRYIITGLLSGVLSVHNTLLVVALPLWFVRHTPMPKIFVGILIMVNTLMAVFLQAWLARSSRTVPGAMRAALAAGIALAGYGIVSQAAPLTTMAVTAVGLALAAVVLLTLGELWQSAASWSLSYELADPNRRTAYLSTFQVGQSLQTAIAPWLITSLVFSAPAGWLYFSVMVVAAGALIRITALKPR